MTGKPVPVRRWLQFGFIAASILTGIHFHRFVQSLADEALLPVARPQEVDAWLPISSFTSLVYFLKTGIANTVRPAGLILFSVSLLVALTARRGFCSWVCPIGTLSEYAYELGQRLFKRNFALPKPLDFLLRSLKYLLLAFFVIVIGRMSADTLHDFIRSPYNRICDIKMYLMFTPPSLTTCIVVSVLGVLSLLVKNFWCRYLCPYGALLGLLSIPSPLAVRRAPETCTGCVRCAKACPNRINVHIRTTVRSPECTACHNCVAACPVPDTLRFGPPSPRHRLSPVGYALIILTALLLIPHVFRTLGYWESDTPTSVYRRHARNISAIGHPPVRPTGATQ